MLDPFPVLAVLAPVITSPQNEIAYPGDPMCLYSALSLTVARTQGRHRDPLTWPVASSPNWGPPPSSEYRLAASDDGVRQIDAEHNSDMCVVDQRTWTDDTVGDLRRVLLARRPRVLLISTVSAAHRYALRIAGLAKEILPECLVVLGGRHVDETVRLDPRSSRLTFAPSSTATVIRRGLAPPVVDFLVAGDGAYALDLLMTAISQGATVEAVVAALHRLGLRGARPCGTAVIVALTGDGPHAFPIRGAGYDLAELPSPYSAFTIRSRFPVFPAPGGGHRRTAHMMTSVSCPFRCSFCSESVAVTGSMRRFAPFDLEPMLIRICEYMHYGAEAIFFDDPVFMAGNVGAMTQFGRALADARAGGRDLSERCRSWLREPGGRARLHSLEWGMQLTVDVLTSVNGRTEIEEMLATVRAAGCTYLYLGIESMSGTVMSSIHKNLRPHRERPWGERVRAALRLVRDADIRVGTSVLFGLDGETRATIDETVEEIGRLIDDDLLQLASPNILTYHPAAPVTDRHGMADHLDYHSSGHVNRPPFVYFEEAYPGVVSSLLTEQDVWHIHLRTRARWGQGRHGGANVGPRDEPAGTRPLRHLDRPVGSRSFGGDVMTVPRNGQRVANGVGSAPAPAVVREIRQAVTGVSVAGANGEPAYLWCDPLTGLIAYPSFADHLTERLPSLAPTELHLAIGDVDDLKQYVTQRRIDDPTCFGHLAGNECMKDLGLVTRTWADRTISSWPFGLCGTFGGDEVIIAAAGKDFGRFVADIRSLMHAINRSVPRTCSFAVGTFQATGLTAADSEQAYRCLVSCVDEALFARKAMLREAHIDPRGDFVDVGRVEYPRTQAVAVNGKEEIR